MAGDGVANGAGEALHRLVHVSVGLAGRVHRGVDGGGVRHEGEVVVGVGGGVDPGRVIGAVEVWRFGEEAVALELLGGAAGGERGGEEACLVRGVCEVGARLDAAHGARGQVVRHCGLLRGVERPQPAPLARVRVADLGGEAPPWPAPHAPVLPLHHHLLRLLRRPSLLLCRPLPCHRPRPHLSSQRNVSPK